MWRWIAEQKRLQHLASQRLTWATEFEKRRAKAKTDGVKPDEIYKLEHEHAWELDEFDDEIAKIETERLIRAAVRYGVPIDHDDELWRTSNWSYDRLLTRKGQYQLRKLVREESAARRAAILSFITALTGLGGVVLGVLALIYKR